MAKIHLTEGFSIIPVGSTIFKITDAEYKEDFGKVKLTLETENGLRHYETYNVQSDGGAKAFSFTAKCALNDFSATEVDPEELIGKFIEADVEHEEVPSKDDPNKTMTFARLKNKRASTGFSASPKTSAPASTGKSAADRLAELLGED